MEFTKNQQNLTVEGRRIKAVFEGGCLLQLQDKDTDRQLVDAHPDHAPLELLKHDSTLHPIGTGDHSECELRMLGDHVAHFWFSDWEADACICITCDDERDEIIVEPSLTAIQDGVAGVRWNMSGIVEETDLVAPFYQGTRLPVGDELLVGRDWVWPQKWEAGYVSFLQKDGTGFYCLTEDKDFRPKTITTGTQEARRTCGFTSENDGPWEGKREAGGLSWRVGLFSDGWQSPAVRYKDWLWNTYPLQKAASSKPDWADSVTLALSWCPCRPKILTVLAQRHPPEKTLLHVPGWRANNYDQNYPDYEPDKAGVTFIESAREMGFRVMPHFNFFAVDPSHALYRELGPYHLRNTNTRRLLGWSWKEGQMLGNPQSPSQIQEHQNINAMAYIHPGLSKWRRELAERIGAIVKRFDLEAVFVDQTLCTGNYLNAIVEGTSTTEGMWHLTRELARIRSGLAIGGEGLNEISMQWQTFAQAHLFDSHHDTIDRLDEVPCPVNDFLFGDLCRTIGYSALSGKDANSRLRLQAHAKLNTLPTITVHSPEEISDPNPAIEIELERASYLG
ncbi:MAG: DUF6259 domain-containing protein [Candidatus Brocadiia bacterium]